MAADSPNTDPAYRVLIFAPVGRDAALTLELLRLHAVAGTICAGINDLCQKLEEGAGAILLTEEALDDGELPLLAAALQRQPAWSDISVLLFGGSDRSNASLRAIRLLEVLRNVTLLERPIRIAAVISTIQAALRGRERQYELRDVVLALRAARDDAESASRLKDDFLATLSHELRTPLNAILGWTSMLRHNQLDPSRADHAHEIIERNARAQAQLIADILDVSRIITGKLRLDVEDVSVPALVGSAIDVVRPAADAKGLHLGVDVAPDVPIIRGDAERLQQVLWNLLSNAVKFTPLGGRVDVIARRSGQQVEISVVDTGAGLAPEFRPVAFERFRQADQSTTRAVGGLGLGLAIVKHLVELHGGQVVAESDGVGRGSTFRLLLPVAVPTEPALPASVHAPPAPVALSAVDPLDVVLVGHRVLIVDDDTSTRELLLTVLEHAGADVAVADSAASGLKALAAERPHVIVADVGMPGEDGYSFVKKVRELPADKGGGTPALALTAYARPSDRAAAEKAGFTKFLAKPALPEDILRAVHQLVTAAVEPRR